MTGEVTTWVVGSGGLLGSSVAARFPARLLWRSRTIPWHHPEAGAVLTEEARRFLDSVGDGAWQVAWCAGAGVTGTDDDSLAVETARLQLVLDVLRQARRPDLGGVFLASSAGGVYAGAAGAPFDEHTSTRPVSPYGVAKLDLEQRLATLHREAGVPVLVGRIANLYGPGQNLGKAQGLISQVIRMHLLGRPISLYVPLDTVRDNLFVTDAARLVEDGLARLRAETAAHGPQLVTKVLASHQAVTVGFLIAEISRVVKRRLRVVYQSSDLAAYQSRDLRLRSTVWPELDAAAVVPLPVGVSRVVRNLRSAMGAGVLA